MVKDLGKVAAGRKLSPVLVVRGYVATARPVTVADGYHRICASYHIDEDATSPVAWSTYASGQSV